MPLDSRFILIVVHHTLLGLIILFASLAYPANATEFTGQVVAIKDGDTSEVLHNKTAERIRLTGIDCP